MSIWATVLQDLYKIFDDYQGRDEELYGFPGAVTIPTFATAALLYVRLFFCDTTLIILPWGRIE